MSFIIKDSENKGRGLFATKFIPLGSLIFTEEPLIYLRDREMKFPNLEHGDTLSLAYELLTKPNFAEIVDKMDNLHESPLNEINLNPLIESFPNFSEEFLRMLVSKISLNSIGYSTFPERIPIILLNDYGNEKINKLPENPSTGIFLQAAMLNHSCQPSAFRYSIGDNIFIRASIDINPGSEITISYIPNDVLKEHYDVKHEYLLGRDFICHDCDMKLLISDCICASQIYKESLDIETIVDIRVNTKIRQQEILQLARNIPSLQARDRLELYLRLIVVLKEDQNKELINILKECYEMVSLEFPWFDFTKITILAEYDREKAFQQAREIISDLTIELFNLIY